MEQHTARPLIKDGSAPILRDATESELDLALEANWRESRRSLGAARDVVVRDEQQLFWFTTGMPIGWFNAVLRANLAADEVAAAFATMRAFFAEKEVPWLWAVGRGSTPADLGTRLEALGMYHVGAVPCMAWRFPEQPIAAPEVARLTIVHANDDALLDEWARLPLRERAHGVENSARMSEIQRAATRHPGRQQFLGYLDGVPVAMATVLLAAGVAGLYGVETLPSTRRQGIGTAMTLAALRWAQERGYHYATLQASDMGRPIYEQMGFTLTRPIDLYSLERDDEN